MKKKMENLFKLALVVLAFFVLPIIISAQTVLDEAPDPQLTRLYPDASGLLDGTHLVTITTKALTNTANGANQTVALFNVQSNVTAVELVAAYNVVPFQDSDDTNYITTAVTVGDGGSTARFLTNLEVNANAAYETLGLGTSAENIYRADDTVDAVFIAQTNKALGSLDAGKMSLIFRLTSGSYPPQ